MDICSFSSNLLDICSLSCSLSFLFCKPILQLYSMFHVHVCLHFTLLEDKLFCFLILHFSMLERFYITSLAPSHNRILVGCIIKYALSVLMSLIVN
uniref:Uncharacterized protein n=1 Tax=Aegilops tauschii subsp. strangulata TaxID=200361 RepID=A0A453RYN7_AEGTS